MRKSSLGAVLIVVAGSLAGAVATAPLAGADCVSSAGTTLCSQGESRGSDTGRGPGTTGPFVPYPCEYDWMCQTSYGWGFGGPW